MFARLDEIRVNESWVLDSMVVHTLANLLKLIDGKGLFIQHNIFILMLGLTMVEGISSIGIIPLGLLIIYKSCFWRQQPVTKGIFTLNKRVNIGLISSDDMLASLYSSSFGFTLINDLPKCFPWEKYMHTRHQIRIHGIIYQRHDRCFFFSCRLFLSKGQENNWCSKLHNIHTYYSPAHNVCLMLSFLFYVSVTIHVISRHQRCHRITSTSDQDTLLSCMLYHRDTRCI